MRNVGERFHIFSSSIPEMSSHYRHETPILSASSEIFDVCRSFTLLHLQKWLMYAELPIYRQKKKKGKVVRDVRLSFHLNDGKKIPAHAISPSVVTRRCELLLLLAQAESRSSSKVDDISYLRQGHLGARLRQKIQAPLLKKNMKKSLV